ncbi:GNAT family N-acetyltransferase [Telmatospirillum sp. J64-1]|uniref:GNAT family N-acetyltransferase n=1 Tax=Telmatospirillum sp. J64-1 TaxID=2502183 RepID=UPI00115F1901|nr:GNAT family N-acetyltransferase [Telmatospirillum sp. J64-1]
MAADQPQIRPATEADAPALFAIRTSVRENHQSIEELAAIGVTLQSVAEMLRAGTARAWIAESGSEPVAFAMARGNAVFALFVHPAHEGRGLGKALLHRAEDWLFRQNEEIWLATGGDPALRAHDFYRRQGWQEAGRLADGQIRYVKARPTQGSV